MKSLAYVGYNIYFIVVVVLVVVVVFKTAALSAIFLGFLTVTLQAS